MKLNSQNHMLAWFFFLVCISTFQAQMSKTKVKIEPPFWWAEMKTSKLQLMVYGQEMADYTASLEYPGVVLERTARLESKNYLFLDLRITGQAKPGKIKISFSKNGKTETIDYELKTRKQQLIKGQRVDPSDVIYLITPDRFANGDTTNDSTDDTLEKHNRDDINGRHGGDLKGIIDNLDYLTELGVTTIWLNPILENDQSAYSYHGYGISDYYKVDPRFGTNEDYANLIDLCHKRGMKVIMDQVFNHCGIGHWWMNDLPSKNWLNQWNEFTRSNFTTITASDPHASEADYRLLTEGWFDNNLPDLNLDNEFVETYLIQNSIWWIEAMGIDGIRMDTYPYPEKEAMAKWLKQLRREYPEYFMVAETWTRKASYLSYWNNKGANNDDYKPYVNSISDYPLYFAILDAFGENGEVYSLFETLAEDFVYGSPENNKVFNGNHDVDRLMALLNNNVAKLKLSMAFVLTTRGIPQLYYGDEILMKNRRPDGAVREDFPGGWPGDARNAFIKNGRTEAENEVHKYVKTILNWRKNATSIHQGKLTHYQPRENIYVYFRHTEQTSTMILLNNSDKDHLHFKLDRFKESLHGFTKGKNILTGEEVGELKAIKLLANTAVIVELEH